MAVAPWIVSDELWELVEPLLPRKERRFRYPGRKRLPIGKRRRGSCSCCTPGSPAARAGRARIRFGRDLWRRLDESQRAGVWQELHAVLLARLRPAGDSNGLGRDRWVVERTFASLHNFERLVIRSEHRADMHHALLALGCCLVCYHRPASSI